jgi:NDP-sugar pyrophosphorylase family protein
VRQAVVLAAKQRRLAGFPIEGYWRTIDTAKDIREAARELGAVTAPPRVHSVK